MLYLTIFTCLTIIPVVAALIAHDLFKPYRPFVLGDKIAAKRKKTTLKITKKEVLHIYFLEGRLFLPTFISLILALYTFALVLLQSVDFLLPSAIFFAALFGLFFLIWFTSLLVAGFRYGDNFITTLGAIKKGLCHYYIDDLHDAHNFFTNSIFSEISRHFREIFDTERKIKQRIELHKRLVEEDYKDEKKCQELLREAVKINESRLAKEREYCQQYTKYGAKVCKTYTAIWNTLILIFLIPLINIHDITRNTIMSYYPWLYNKFVTIFGNEPKPPQ